MEQLIGVIMKLCVCVCVCVCCVGGGTWNGVIKLMLWGVTAPFTGLCTHS